MLSSFVILAIIGIFRVIAGVLANKFTFLTELVTILNWGCGIMAVVFGLFVVISLIKLIRKK